MRANFVASPRILVERRLVGATPAEYARRSSTIRGSVYAGSWFRFLDRSVGGPTRLPVADRGSDVGPAGPAEIDHRDRRLCRLCARAPVPRRLCRRFLVGAAAGRLAAAAGEETRRS